MDAEADEAVCPHGHALQTFSVEDKGWMCDVCKRELEVGEEVQGCKLCDWDFCSRCSQNAAAQAEADVFAQQAVGPAQTTRKLSRGESEEDSEEELLAAPALYGHLYKKSPGAFRLRGWDHRFFVLFDLKLLWWSNEQHMLKALRTEESEAGLKRLNTMKTVEELDAKTDRKGMIDLAKTQAIVEADVGSGTVFMVRPIGSWAEGATTDIRGDDKRVYTLDARGSEHPREVWMETLRHHIREGAERRATGKAGVSECWEDVSISNDQARAAATLVQKLEARQRR